MKCHVLYRVSGHTGRDDHRKFQVKAEIHSGDRHAKDHDQTQQLCSHLGCALRRNRKEIRDEDGSKRGGYVAQRKTLSFFRRKKENELSQQYLCRKGDSMKITHCFSPLKSPW